MTAPQPKAPSEINTLEDASLALHELSWLEYEHSVRQAKAKKEIDAVVARQADLFAVRIDDELVPIVDRRAAVEEQLSAWCKEHLKENLPEGKKSADLPHGTLGFRQTPLGVELADGVVVDDVLNKLDRKTDFRMMINKILEKLIGKHVLSYFMVIDYKLSFSKILNALKAGAVDQKSLKPLGIVIREPKDVLFIKPATYAADPNHAT